jgi:hypothetical protein
MTLDELGYLVLSVLYALLEAMLYSLVLDRSLVAPFAVVEWEAAWGSLGTTGYLVPSVSNLAIKRVF